MRRRGRRPAARAARAISISMGAGILLGVGACGGGAESERARTGSEPVAVEPAGPRAPNVVLVVTDDQRAETVSVMPKLQRLIGARGTTFEQAIATTPQCCPSRATLFTGRYVHNHRVRTNSAPEGGYPKLRSDRALPVWLQRAGYRTAHVGRYLNDYGNSRTGGDPLEIPPGWDEWHAPVEHTEFQNFGYTLNENGTLVTYGEEPSDYSTDVYAGLGAGFIRESAAAGDPFFLSVATHTPHKEGVLGAGASANPRPAPRHEDAFDGRALPRGPAYNEADVTDKPRRVADKPPLSPAAARALERGNRARLASLLAIDDLVGRLAGELRRAGELRDTLFIFTSDHGFMLGEHRLSGKNEIYEPSLRIPLLVRGRGFGAGAKAGELVGNIDVAPTIVAATGVVPDFEMDGLPLAGRREAVRRRAGLEIEHFERPRFKGVRTPGWLYAEIVPGARELYDLRRDPHQLENLAGRPGVASREATLETLLTLLEGCEGADCTVTRRRLGEEMRASPPPAVEQDQ